MLYNQGYILVQLNLVQGGINIIIHHLMLSHFDSEGLKEKFPELCVTEIEKMVGEPYASFG